MSFSSFANFYLIFNVSLLNTQHTIFIPLLSKESLVSEGVTIKWRICYWSSGYVEVADRYRNEVVVEE